MDEETLNQILQDANNRQFWIVLWGYPELSADEGKQVFDEPVYDEGLTRNVPDMRIGDVLFVHRIHVSKIIYISEVIEPPRIHSTGDREGRMAQKMALGDPRQKHEPGIRPILEQMRRENFQSGP